MALFAFGAALSRQWLQIGSWRATLLATSEWTPTVIRSRCLRNPGQLRGPRWRQDQR